MNNTLNTKQKSFNQEKSQAQLCNILNQLMRDCDIDAVQLSKNTGVTQTTINRLRNDPYANPTKDTLVSIAHYFKITVSQLLGDEPLNKDESGKFNPNIQNWDFLPLITWEQAARWSEISNSLEQSKHDRWISTDLNLSENSFAITMKGDSMYPRFSEGTTLIIEPNQEATNRDFVLILLPGQKNPVFKQILFDGEDIYLKSLNEDFTEIKKLHVGDGYKIIGVMVQARTNFMRNK